MCRRVQNRNRAYTFIELLLREGLLLADEETRKLGTRETIITMLGAT